MTSPSETLTRALARDAVAIVAARRRREDSLTELVICGCALRLTEAWIVADEWTGPNHLRLQQAKKNLIDAVALKYGVENVHSET